MAEAAHEIAAQANTLLAPNLSHRNETTSREAANEAVKAPCTKPARVAVICHASMSQARHAG